MNVSTVRPLEKGTFGTAFLILPLYRFPYTEQQFRSNAHFLHTPEQILFYLIEMLLIVFSL
uniref:AlNc14C64G4574 protein n=1 Tax=Albugo laibachii Nc14 TaxID=890382 RepID=F0WD53_9STRA|nr:AlNc14C64G4574 [Albugo laibachii Nc14]|eukprot:CCA19125.1 AlNc14C64G4574 [Albugo laibachii Nc14]